MKNEFEDHVREWMSMQHEGRFVEARQYYFDKLFKEIIDNFCEKTNWPLEPVDVLFSILGNTPEPIILAARALKPRKHIIFHDKGVAFNEDNLRYLPEFLEDGFEKVELSDESFSCMYDNMKYQMALNAGKNYTVNVTGGKKSMVASAAIFARDYNANIIYIDVKQGKYNADIRRPIPGAEFMNLVYSPVKDLPELFHQ
jgi:hypothetical protein